MGFSLTLFFFIRPDRSPRTRPVFGGVRAAWKKKPEIPQCFHRRPFQAKAYVILTLVLCDWSIQQSANKPQIQKEKHVVRLWVAAFFFGGGGALRDIPQKTAVEENKFTKFTLKRVLK